MILINEISEPNFGGQAVHTNSNTDVSLGSLRYQFYSFAELLSLVLIKWCKAVRGLVGGTQGSICVPAWFEHH